MYFAFHDGGVKGNEGALVSCLVDPDEGKTLPKVKRALHTMITEEADGNTVSHSRGALAVAQLQTTTMCTKNAIKTAKKPRKHSPGTTAGDCMTGIGLPSRTKGWQCSYAEKKILYWPSKRREPGGACDDSGARPNEKRENKDIEPFNFWQHNQAFYEEFLNYDIIGVIDIAACNGNFPTTCIYNQVPYLGIAFNEENKAALTTIVDIGSSISEMHVLNFPKCIFLCHQHES